MKIMRILCHCEAEEKVPVNSLGLPPSLLETLTELEVIEIEEESITPAELQRALRMLRLCKALEVDLTGAAIIVELLEKMEEMEEELERLRRNR